MSDDRDAGSVDPVAESTRIPWDRPGAAFRVLDTYARHIDEDRLNAIKERLGIALSDWPELASDTITVGRTPPDHDERGIARGYNRLIELPIDGRTSNVTIYHELGHVAIDARKERGEDHPGTEEYCSIFAMARMPTAMVDERRVPYLTNHVAVSRGLLPHICKMALRYREDHHNYIQQCNRWISGEEDYLESPYHAGGGA